jgi:hypothetical protein
LTLEEVDELFSSWCVFYGLDAKAGEWQALKQYMIERSESHPGLFTYILDHLDEACNLANQSRDDVAMLSSKLYKCLLRPSFYLGLLHIRGFLL